MRTYRARAHRRGLLRLVVVGGMMSLFLLLGRPAPGASELLLSQDDPQPVDTTEPSTPDTEASPDAPEDEGTDEGIGTPGIALIVVVGVFWLVGGLVDLLASLFGAAVPRRRGPSHRSAGIGRCPCGCAHLAGDHRPCLRLDHRALDGRLRNGEDPPQSRRRRPTRRRLAGGTGHVRCEGRREISRAHPPRAVAPRRLR